MNRRFRAAGLMLMWVLAALGTVPEASVASDQASALWRLAQLEQAALEQRGVVLGDAPLSAYLQGVANRLWKQVPTSSLAVPTIKVIKDTRIDAYAYPNGHCFVSTGMLDVLENESQLAMVLAHEMVHYARQHTAVLYNHFQHTTAHATAQTDDRPPLAARADIHHKIDTAERQADGEGFSILKASGYDETQVLPLMSNLMKRMRDRGDAETVGLLEQRIDFFSQRIEQNRENQPGTTSTGNRPDGYLDRISAALVANAQVALRRGEWGQADRSICKVLASKPEDARAYYLKGEILRRQHGSDGDNPCIGSYKKALKIDPSFPLAHRALGELHYKAGRYQAARPYFEAFLSLAPQDDAREYIKGYLRQCQN